MRRSHALLLAVVFAGCSSPHGAPGIPVTAQSAQTRASSGAAVVAAPKLLELQLEGKMPAPVPQEVLRYNYNQLNRPRPQLAFSPNANVAIWASDTNFDYILGQDSSGLNTLTAIDGMKTNCYSPVAVKVDHEQNLWVGCEMNTYNGTNGTVQEYTKAGTLEKQFTPACPTAKCTSFNALVWDSGTDSSGNVFDSLNLYSIETCTPSCTSTLGGGFEWWPHGNQAASPHLIPVSPSCKPVCGVGFMDVDPEGNLWFTFAGYTSSGVYGFGLGEVKDPTGKPAVSIIEPIGTYGFFGGVYVSNHGKTLNVVDQKARTISQYHMPLATHERPFNVLGPTPQNAFGLGIPTSGGFNETDTKLAIADADGWLDLATVSRNTWKTAASPNFYSGIEGAAYSPSDK